jgi:hypothetical protein
MQSGVRITSPTNFSGTGFASKERKVSSISRPTVPTASSRSNGAYEAAPEWLNDVARVPSLALDMATNWYHARRCCWCTPRELAKEISLTKKVCVPLRARMSG